MGCVIHIFLSLYSFISEFVIIGTFVQDGIPLFGVNSTNNFYMAIVFISVIFYIVAIVIVFQAYKEFKAVSMEGLLQQPGLGGGGYYDQEDEQDYGQQYYQPQQPAQQLPQNRPQPQPQPQPIGQSQPQPQPVRNVPANQNVQMTNSANNQQSSSINRNSGGFQAFAGTGHKIGGS
jgi:hypothetical protein